MSGHISFKVKVMEPAADSWYMVEDYNTGEYPLDKNYIICYKQ